MGKAWRWFPGGGGAQLEFYKGNAVKFGSREARGGGRRKTFAVKDMGLQSQRSMNFKSEGGRKGRG
jgi:hypothetical protein